MRNLMRGLSLAVLAVGLGAAGCTNSSTGDEDTSSSSSSSSSTGGSSVGQSSSRAGSSSAAASSGGSSAVQSSSRPASSAAGSSSLMGGSSSGVVVSSSVGGGSSGVVVSSSDMGGSSGVVVSSSDMGGSSGVVVGSSSVGGGSSGVVVGSSSVGGGSSGVVVGSSSVGGGSSGVVVGSSSVGGGSSGVVVGSSSVGGGSSSAGGSSSSGGPVGETACADGQDNDNDERPDCSDTDCQGTAACVPGAGATGTACTVATNCQATGGDPVCLAQDGEQRPGGYCSEFCDPFAGGGGSGGCTGTSVCLVINQQTQLAVCFDACDPMLPMDCRTGYSCTTTIGSNVCVDAEDGPLDCADFEDNDLDGLVDCQDPACQGLAQCAPGAQAAGTACTGNTQCNAVGNDPVCLTETGVGWPAGSCAEFCDLSGGVDGNPSCQTGTRCIPSGAGNGICLDACTLPTDCRPGYTCDPFDQVCFPACTSNADCPTVGYCEQTVGSQDFGRCIAPVCGDSAVEGPEQCDPPGSGCTAGCLIQEVDCVNFNDDDNDGLTDCQDSDCAAQCTPGTTPTGGACTTANNCVATGNDPVCVPDMFGWPQGYCTERCTVMTNTGCSAGGACVDFDQGNTPFGYCMDVCVLRSDCRTGYECGTLADASGTNVRICIPAETACSNFTDDDADGLLDCADSDCAMDLQCAGGSLPAGSSCMGTIECDSTVGNDPACITESDSGWPGGFCSEWCDVTLPNQCPVGFACAPAGGGPTSGLCVQSCAVTPTCTRTEYACGLWSGVGSPEVCLPACTSDTQCTVTGSCAPSTHPNAGSCVVAQCGNGTRESTEECDGADVAPGFVCSFRCTAVPVAWTCDTFSYGGEDGCHCGCGVVDPDCADNTLASCNTCFTFGSCSNQDCSGNTQIDPLNNAVCTFVPGCGNNVREPTEQCDGTDTPPGFRCNLSCVAVPVAWTCNDAYFSDGSCDCGCGLVDMADCTSATLAACQYCNDSGSCSTQLCAGNTQIDPANNGICVVVPPMGTPEVEGNNTPALAQDLGTLAAGTLTTVSAAITPVADLDFFRFTLAAPANVQLTTFGTFGALYTTCPGDTLMYLYNGVPTNLTATTAAAEPTLVEFDDDDGSNVCSQISGTDVAPTFVSLAAGTYYVQIHEFVNNDLIPGYYLGITVQ